MPKTWIWTKKAHAGGTCPAQEPCGYGCSYNGSTCVDYDECSSLDDNTCWPPTTCSNTIGSFECHCPDGSVGDFGPSPNCDGPPPMPGCPAQEPCGDGCYYSDGTCVDRNECALVENICLAHSPPTTCVNTIGSFECHCPDGSVADAAGNCGSPPPPGSWWTIELIFHREFCSDLFKGFNRVEL